LGLAACGDNGDASPNSSAESYDVEASTVVTAAKPVMDKARFIRRFDRICRKAWERVYANWDQYRSTQDRKLSAEERFDDAVRNSLLAGLDFYIFDNFRIIGSPPGEEREIEKIIGPFQATVELGWKQRWQARSIGDIATQFEIYNRRAERYGFSECLVDEPHLSLVEG
jgi:hypothetical protein